MAESKIYLKYQESNQNLSQNSINFKNPRWQTFIFPHTSRSNSHFKHSQTSNLKTSQIKIDQQKSGSK